MTNPFFKMFEAYRASGGFDERIAKLLQFSLTAASTLEEHKFYLDVVEKVIHPPLPCLTAYRHEMMLATEDDFKKMVGSQGIDPGDLLTNGVFLNKAATNALVSLATHSIAATDCEIASKENYYEAIAIETSSLLKESPAIAQEVAVQLSFGASENSQSLFAEILNS